MDLQIIREKIYELRGQKIMLDFDLAEMYDEETKVLKQAVRRNIDRFPSDFMFELTKEEFESLRSHFVTSKRGGLRYMPFAFTEQGVAMLSSVLRSKKAIRVNILIIRAFVLFRQHLSDCKNLQVQVEKIEKEMRIRFSDINQALILLFEKNDQESRQKQRKRIGY